MTNKQQTGKVMSKKDEKYIESRLLGGSVVVVFNFSEGDVCITWQVPQILQVSKGCKIHTICMAKEKGWQDCAVRAFHNFGDVPYSTQTLRNVQQ